MARRLLVTGIIAGGLTLGSAAAGAQTRTDRFFISVNGGVQAPAGDLRDSFEFEEHAETGSVTVEYPGRTGGLFDGSAGLRLWRRLGVGVGFSRASSSAAAGVSASVPHPLLDESHRAVEGDASGIERAETAVHVLLYYDVPTRGPLRVRLFGGPTFMTARQDLVDDVDVTEEYPFDTAAFAAAGTRRAEGSGTGFHAGLDFSWMFARRIGAGALARYTRASVDLGAGPSRSVPADTGGVQAVAGLRIAF